MDVREKRKLLIPGWAGELTMDEMRFIREKISGDKQLRREWCFRRGNGYRLSEDMIRHRAMYGV